MPNHVSQDLWVTGPVEALEAFEQFAKEDVDGGTLLLSANKFIPYPEKYKLADEASEAAMKNGDYSVASGFGSGGYHWCIINWGTKWGIYDCFLVSKTTRKNSGTLKYNFNSAWSPAKTIIHAMGMRFPTLTFKLRYYEGGMCFKGLFVTSAGKIITDDSSEYRGRRGG